MCRAKHPPSLGAALLKYGSLGQSCNSINVYTVHVHGHFTYDSGMQANCKLAPWGQPSGPWEGKAELS